MLFLLSRSDLRDQRRRFLRQALHDGAVILRGDRVAAAGCILPLTQDPLSPTLGTRHRAALGMAVGDGCGSSVRFMGCGTVNLDSKLALWGGGYFDGGLYLLDPGNA